MKIIIFLMILLSIGGYKFFENNDDMYIVSEEENVNEVVITTNDTFDNKKTVTIFISGEVLNPGVVTLDSDKRLWDAVNLVGGTTVDADLNNINLAIKLEDEKHYIIPKVGENIQNQETKKDENNDKININTASVEELDSLPGVGESTANKIISHREENGEFLSIEEIQNVNGIGEKKYDEIKNHIDV